MSNGAPFYSAQGDINKFLLTEVSDIKECIGNIEGDIKVIKGYIEDKKQDNTNSTKLKASMIGSLIMGLSGIIVAVISFFKSG